MYPKPKPNDIGPKWLGAVTKWAKKGFEVYNLVKKFIPSENGSGKVPGTPSELEDELFELLNFGGLSDSLSSDAGDKVKFTGKGVNIAGVDLDKDTFSDKDKMKDAALNLGKNIGS